MHNKIDVRGVQDHQALGQLEQVLKTEHPDSLEILCSGKELSAALIQMSGQYGASCEVLDTAAGQQTIIATFVRQPVMKQKSYVVGSDSLGKGDDVIGQKLMNAFFNVSSEYEQVPASVFFLNTGVKVCTEDSAVVDALKKLEEKGCDILVCGTCLDFFGLKEKLAVGRIGTMHDLIQIYHQQTEVIAL